MKKRQAKKIAWYINDEFTWKFYDKCKKEKNLIMFFNHTGWYPYLFKHYRMKTLMRVAKKYKGGMLLTTLYEVFNYKKELKDRTNENE